MARGNFGSGLMKTWIGQNEKIIIFYVDDTVDVMAKIMNKAKKITFHATFYFFVHLYIKDNFYFCKKNERN